MLKKAILMLLLLPALALAAAPRGDAADGALRYFDGRQWRPLWPGEHELAEIVPRDSTARRLVAPAPGAQLIRQRGRLRIWRLADGQADALSRALDGAAAARFSPVFYLSPRGGEPLVPDGRIVVRFPEPRDEAHLAQWAESQGLEWVGTLSLAATYLFAADSGMAAVAKANAIQQSGEVRYAVPQWWRPAYLQ